jgi:hypothetical protein
MSAFVDASVLVRYLTADPPEMLDAARRIVDEVNALVLTDVVLRTAHADLHSWRTAYISCNMYAMHRTTIFLDERLLRSARQYAERSGKSFAAVVREALAAYIAGEAGTVRRLPSVAGAFASGRSDTSERVDEFLWPDPHR